MNRNSDVLELRPIDYPVERHRRSISATGHEVSFLGCVHAKMKIADKQIMNVDISVAEYLHNVDCILGMNILRKIPHDKSDHDPLSNLLNTVDKLNNMQHNVIRLATKKTIVKPETDNIVRGSLRITPANFPRTILCKPTDEAIAYSNLLFDETIVEVPPNVKTCHVPVRILNYTDRKVKLPHQMSLCNVETVDIVEHIDDVNVTEESLDISDSEFLEKFPSFDENVTSDQVKQLNDLLIRHRKTFAMNDLELGLVKGHKMHIKLDDETPIKQKFREVHPAHRQEVFRQIEKMLKMNVIENSDSPWSSPLTTAIKADGSVRLCLDLRKVNARTCTNAKPLPKIDTLLSQFHNKKYFTSFDCLSSFWQIELDKESRPYTAFSVGSHQHYQWCRVPFGAKNSSAVFQTVLEKVLEKFIQKNQVILYIDDITIATESYHEHVKILDDVLDTLEKSGMKLKPKKTKLLCSKLKFLGFQITKDGISADPDKVKDIVDWKTPTTTKQLKSFYGLISFYRRFIPNFSKIAAPLNELLKGRMLKVRNRKRFDYVPFVWNTDRQEAFEKLKQLLLHEVVLSYPDMRKQFCLYIDASVHAFGAVLCQKIDDYMKPIAFASRATNKTETKYDVHKLEFRALLYAVEKFKDYLMYSKFVVYTEKCNCDKLNNYYWT